MNQPRFSNRTNRIAMLGLLAGFVAAAAFTSTARAQAGAAPAAPAPTHIGVIDFRKAYLTMKETKDSMDQIKGIEDELEVKGKSDNRALQDLQTEMTQAVKADSAKHQELMEEYDKKGLQFQMEEQALKVKMARIRGHQMKKAFDEISAAVADIAKKKGLDVVMVNSGQDLPDTIGDINNQEQLVNLIFARSFLYVSPKVDITDEVVVAVDAANAKPATPPPAH